MGERNGTTALAGWRRRLVVLLTGLSMASVRWPWDSGWIITAILAVLLLFGLGIGVTGARFAAFGRGVAQARLPVASALQEIKSDPAVRISFHIRALALVGVLFLMTNKPGLLESVTILVVAIVLGAGSVLLAARGEPSPTT